MKRLILLRHAKSSWKERGLADHDRPLSQRGKRDAPRMGERLRRRGARPDLIVTSSALRARKTAKHVSKALFGKAKRIAVDPDLYLASPRAILGIIANQDASVSELIVVGHNPGFADLANRLLPDFDLDNLPTAGVVGIDIAADRWASVSAGTATLAYYDYPKNPEPVLSRDRTDS